jgi:hypothetical protein
MVDSATQKASPQGFAGEDKPIDDGRFSEAKSFTAGGAGVAGGSWVAADGGVE